jgi:Protein of unknown function (DUF2934)
MSTQTSAPSPTALSESDPNSLQPCREGYDGLTPTQQAARAEMLHRAYSIWRSKGSPDNSQVADWLEAEAEVLKES